MCDRDRVLPVLLIERRCAENPIRSDQSAVVADRNIKTELFSTNGKFVDSVLNKCRSR